MGLFQHRPEDPVEWAGLPSEPLRDESAAERLNDVIRVDLDRVDLDAGAPVQSVVIPLPAVDDAGDEDQSPGR